MPIFANENFTGMYGSSGLPGSYYEETSNNNPNEERFTNCGNNKKHDNNRQVVEGFIGGDMTTGTDPECPGGYTKTPLGDSGAFYCEPPVATGGAATPETVTNVTEVEMRTSPEQQRLDDEAAAAEAAAATAEATAAAAREAAEAAREAEGSNTTTMPPAPGERFTDYKEGFSNMANNMANNNMVNNVGNMLNNNLENIPNNVLANEPVNMLNNTVNNVPRNNMNNQVNYTANDVSDDVLNLNLFLKSLLFACLFYILAHPETMKYVKPALGKLTQDNQRLVMLLVFVVCYYIISLFI